MTWAMYQQLDSALTRLQAEPAVRVAVLRGQHGTFVSGTDIAQFTSFQSGADGLAYERRLDEIVTRLESCATPTLAVVEGHAMGAGLIMAAVCDLRICTPDARFGMPIARTVGNCLSIAQLRPADRCLWSARVKAMIFCGGVHQRRGSARVRLLPRSYRRISWRHSVDQLCQRIAEHAPISLAVTKEALRRIAQARLPNGDDLVERAYGSQDFHEGVAAFLEKRTPHWRGL